MPGIHMISLNAASPEFDAAYDLISADIAPEYLETREFLRNRLLVRDEGPKTEQEKMLVQDGYTLHFIAAVQESQVVGAIYGHLISKITREDKAVGFVTYITVHPDFRKRGIGTVLIAAMQHAVEEDADRLTGRSIFGMVYEIEEEGKKEIKATVSGLGARPLDIVYYQPALRVGYEPQRMDLWFQPVPAPAPGQAGRFSLDVKATRDIVRNMFIMEYVGPTMTGFDLSSKPYVEFMKSIGRRRKIGLLF